MGAFRTLLSKLCLVSIRLFPLTRFYALKSSLLRIGGLTLGANVRVISSARFVTPFVEIGENTFISYECLIIAAHGSRIRIGKNVDIGPRVTITTGNHYFGGPEHRAGDGYVRDVEIGDGAWVASNSVIVSGIKIGKGAVVAAGSVVTRSIPDNVMAIGNPVRIVPIPEGHPSRSGS